MNLFVLGVDLAPGDTDELRRALSAVAASYPTLDPGTRWEEDGGSFFASSLHHAPAVSRPHRYVSRGDDVVFYDGLPVSVSPGVTGHDAVSLAASWGRLGAALEGQYVAVRVRPRERAVELVVDPLGLAQVYEARWRGAHLFSNSARLLAGLTGDGGVDLAAAAMMASIAWVGGDRTLHPGVRTVPAGETWTWQDGRGEVAIKPTVVLDALRAGRTGLRHDDVAAATEAMVSMVASVGDAFGPLAYGLTGGRDSRLVAALVREADVAAHAYTWGAPGDPDVDLAADVAAAAGVAHEVTLGDRDLAEPWDAAWRRLLAQNDGLVSLRHVSGHGFPAAATEPLTVRVWGAGGEMARTVYTAPHLAVAGAPAGLARRSLLTYVVRRHGGLVTPAAAEQVAATVGAHFDRALDLGARPVDAIDHFYADDRVRRWAYTNSRAFRPHGESFSPFCSRPYLELGYRATPAHRYAATVHRKVLELLAPDLHALPYDRPLPLRGHAAAAVDTARRTGRFAARKVDRRRRSSPATAAEPAFDRFPWFEAVREELRTRCLDQSSSELWEVVDRPTFDRLTAGATPEAVRRPLLGPLLDAATLLHHASLPTRLPGDDRARTAAGTAPRPATPARDGGRDAPQA